MTSHNPPVVPETRKSLSILVFKDIVMVSAEVSEDMAACVEKRAWACPDGVDHLGFRS